MKNKNQKEISAQEKNFIRKLSRCLLEREPTPRELKYGIKEVED